MNKSVVLWESGKALTIPNSVSSPVELVSYASQLRPKDQQQIIKALEAENYDMASTYIWVKAMAALRKILANLGSEFIGEMLQRPDISSGSDLMGAVTDSEAILLAEDLGIISATEALRMRHAHETISHFAQLDADEENIDLGVTHEEAMLCVRACVQSVLGQPKLDVASNFAEFRRKMEQITFKTNDSEISALLASPYFYWKTTLSILLSLLKTARGAQLEHAVRNVDLVIVLLWERLKKPEKWQAGQTYSELYADGKTDAANGLKKALLKVSGFDYVPENLRSSSFSKAATEVLRAHEGFDNFHNESIPMKALASLGTTIPNPAFRICMTATLSVWLGNSYGHSWSAEPYAAKVLSTLSKPRWTYYLDECLFSDRSILFKLSESKPAQRFVELVAKFNLSAEYTHDKSVKQLLAASADKKVILVQKLAKNLYEASYKASR